MKIAADTNVLLRAFVKDNAGQETAARDAFDSADLIAISTHALCEFVWVMRSGYRRPASEIAAAIRILVSGEKVVIDQQAVIAGLAILDQGGDFADGVIAHEGRTLGGGTFVSFDKSAAGMLKREGVKVRVLG